MAGETRAFPAQEFIDRVEVTVTGMPPSEGVPRAIVFEVPVDLTFTLSRHRVDDPELLNYIAARLDVIMHEFKAAMLVKLMDELAAIGISTSLKDRSKVSALKR